MKKRQSLDIYDDMPSGMKKYISNYGWHFTAKLCDYAVSLMRKKGAGGEEEKIEALTQTQLDELLKKNAINLANNVLSDALFVVNMAKADYYKKSIADETHLAMFVKDYIDDVDAPDGVAMRRWLATMVGLGIPVDWEEVL